MNHTQIRTGHTNSEPTTHAGADRSLDSLNAHQHDHDHHDRHDRHTTQPGEHQHAGHDKHAGHDPEMFRRRFWLSLALTIPLVVTSHMVMGWFNYTVDLPLMEWYGPVLGSIVFWWGGWPFLAGGVAEIRNRQPGMMLLITMAITLPISRRWRRVSNGSTSSSGGSSRLSSRSCCSATGRK